MKELESGHEVDDQKCRIGNNNSTVRERLVSKILASDHPVEEDPGAVGRRWRWFWIGSWW